MSELNMDIENVGPTVYDYFEQQTDYCSYCKREHNIYICMKEEEDRELVENTMINGLAKAFNQARYNMRRVSENMATLFGIFVDPF